MLSGLFYPKGNVSLQGRFVSSILSHPAIEKGQSMKRVGMWCTLGMSLFLILSAEAANLNNRLVIVNDPDFGTPPVVRSGTQLQVQGRSPTIPIPMLAPLKIQPPAQPKSEPELEQSEIFNLND